MRSVADIFRSYAVFDADGRHVNGTDKMSNHNYGDTYEILFTKSEEVYCSDTTKKTVVELIYRGSLRNDAKLVMEIGVADGSSLLAWREVFPNALCVGMDIHDASRLHEPCNEPQRPIEFHIGDQRRKDDCERAAAGRQFDLIVEDATHELQNTLLTLYWLWPFVKPGGMYIVEEWSNVDRARITSLWPQAEVVDTQGPFGGIEPLVVFRKPL